MRVRIDGDCNVAIRLRELLPKCTPRIAVVNRMPDYTVHLLADSDCEWPELDSIDCTLERNVMNLLQQNGVGTVLVKRAGGIQSDKEMHVSYPPKMGVQVEKAILVALEKERQDKPWWRRSLFVLALVAWPTIAGAQVNTVQILGVDGVNKAGVNASNQLMCVLPAGSGGLTDAELRASPVPVSVSGSVAVTGTFWQATQPVSGTVSCNLNAGTNNIGDVDVLTLPAIPAGTNNIGDVDVLTLPSIPAGTNNIGDVDVLTLPALSAGTNRIGSVRPVDSADADLTSAKGTQTSRFLGVQEVHDAGRTAISFYANAVASGTTGTETLITLTQSKGTAATSAAASYTITNGKTLRILAIIVGSRGHSTATAQITTFNLRMNTGGACVVGSTPILLGVATATPATSLAWDRATIPVGDGYDIVGNGTIAICISANAVFTTNAPTWFVNIVGYEF